ncbi:MAG TPA: acetyl-CoA carboxylase biotin carboxyl carrier protein [Hyphomonadaceae bacterium]|jgi:acetyl-CoA carboxylase biotin carboxyl carrier protein|nr:acetyl-CoA carboxylase biotin carboxyl carrier protein [Hyphomonadaceae bacterium]
MADKPTTPNGKFDTGLIRELAAILREADLGEIEIEQGGLRIKVVKPEAKTVQYAAAPSYAPAPTASAPAAGAAPKPAAVPAADNPGAVKSPMVGTVYLAPEEGAAQFVKVGDTVATGQTILLIEAMKTFNPVLAPRAGKVTAILCKNTQPVEFGEPLVIIE